MTDKMDAAERMIAQAFLENAKEVFPKLKLLSERAETMCFKYGWDCAYDVLFKATTVLADEIFGVEQVLKDEGGER